ncbi:MAG: hypothetical protein COB93_07900 [Sneathiella sp.]|nr:MAG: hypothetical protein COB93_07900 [Sneathiella sp.]
MKTVVVCSGGMDSVVLTHLIAKEQDLARLISVSYGQRHVKEIDSAGAKGQG